MVKIYYYYLLFYTAAFAIVLRDSDQCARSVYTQNAGLFLRLTGRNRLMTGDTEVRKPSVEY